MISNEDARLWSLVRETTSQTTMQVAVSGDEDAWTDIVSPLIKSVMSDSREEHVFDVMSVY